MTTALLAHPACADHDPGAGHPESPARLDAVMLALESDAFHALDRRLAPIATAEQLARVHRADYVEAVLAAMPAEGRVMLDGDTIVSPGSKEAALRAAGAVVAAVDAVVAGEVRNAFCAVRPPGHHAEANRPMGFCIFNNIAVGALHARAAHGLERVAVVDFDVHHGNGTQHVFEGDPALLYASTHQWPFYPGTGASDERGCGNVWNVPLAANAGSVEFRAALREVILPALDRFGPDLVMISAGFDAHRADPLAMLQLDESDYVWVTGELMRIADRHAEGRVVSALEGGYDLGALRASAAAHVGRLMASGRP